MQVQKNPFAFFFGTFWSSLSSNIPEDCTEVLVIEVFLELFFEES